MSEPITYVGIDAHKADLQVALLVPDATEPVVWGSPKTGVGGLRSNRWAPPRVATGRAACQRAARVLRVCRA